MKSRFWAYLMAATVLAASFSLGLSAAAQANSIVATSPVVGSVLAVAPNAISVTAASSLLDQGNSLVVTDPAGKQVDDGSLTISDTTAVIGLKPLTASGIYSVAYTLLSATDAPLTGSFTFLFNAPASITAPSTAPTPVMTSPTKTKVLTSNSSATVTMIVFLVLATLVAMFLLWYARMILLQSRKARKSAARKRSAK